MSQFVKLMDDRYGRLGTVDDNFDAPRTVVTVVRASSGRPKHI